MLLNYGKKPTRYESEIAVVDRSHILLALPQIVGEPPYQSCHWCWVTT